MGERPWLLPALLWCAFMASCGTSSDGCVITTAIIPPNATADHSAAAPGNEVQFSTSSTVTGNNCPQTPDTLGVWSTSDPVNTTISNQASTDGLATCLNATPTPATIRNSSTVRGHGFPPATLVCK